MADAPAIVIPAPGADVLRACVREMHDAHQAVRVAQDAATTADQRAIGVEAALRAALQVPTSAALDLSAGVFRLPVPSSGS